MDRKKFIAQTAVLALGAACLPGWLTAKASGKFDFSTLGTLTPVGRVLEMEGYYVWCSSPIDGPDGKVHLFFSRWDAARKMGGWLKGSEIAHAVADHAEGPFEYVSTILAPRGEGYWDATTCHNPLITKVDDKYCLFFMGNSNGKKRIPNASGWQPQTHYTGRGHDRISPYWKPVRQVPGMIIAPPILLL